MGKIDEIERLFASPLGERDVAFTYLGYSGVIVRTANRTVVIDPADLLDTGAVKALEDVDLLLFTHSHRDHYNATTTQEIFEATGTPILAESLVAEDLKAKISRDKLIVATPGTTYTFDGIRVQAIEGIHRGPINLYRIEMGGVSVFHGGDSGYVPVKDYSADVAFLPTGSPSPTASPECALNMTSELQSRFVALFHGSADQCAEFVDKAKTAMPATRVLTAKANVTQVVTIDKN